MKGCFVLVRLTSLLLGSFIACILVLRLPAYQQPDLLTLLQPPDCPAPCFLGIRPTITAASDAIRILAAHPWVEAVQSGEHAISWLWNGQQPAFLYNLDSPRAGRFGGVMLLSRQVVQSISLASRVSFGDLVLTMGVSPDRVTNVSINYGRQVRLTVPYRAYGFVVEVQLDCPISPTSYWNSASSLSWAVPRSTAPITANPRFGELLPLFRRYQC